MENNKQNSWVQVHSGGKFFPFDPRPEDVNIKDIAKSLSYLCRFNGHSSHFYSVGQHSLLCAEMLLAERQSMRVALIGLLHDASEAYFGDVPTPIKAFLPELKSIEENIEQAIYDGLGIARPTAEEASIVRRMDATLLINEARTLTPHTEQWTAKYETGEYSIIPAELFNEQDVSKVETKFLTFFELLKSECAREEREKKLAI